MHNRYIYTSILHRLNVGRRIVPASCLWEARSRGLTRMYFILRARERQTYQDPCIKSNPQFRRKLKLLSLLAILKLSMYN
jgi:hypothetical protein